MPDTPDEAALPAPAETPEVAQVETPPEPAPEPPLQAQQMPAETWPAPASAPGDEDRIAKILHELAAVTDVASLETILAAVLSRCTSARVHPHVIQQRVAGVLKSYDSRTRDYTDRME